MGSTLPVSADLVPISSVNQAATADGTDASAQVIVDTTPHVSYDISLSAFTPHYRQPGRDQGHSGDRTTADATDEEAEEQEAESEEPVYYSHACRCSSEFIITYQDLLDGVDVVGCGGCGEWVRVGYEAVSDDDS